MNIYLKIDQKILKNFGILLSIYLSIRVLILQLKISYLNFCLDFI